MTLLAQPKINDDPAPESWERSNEQTQEMKEAVNLVYSDPQLAAKKLQALNFSSREQYLETFQKVINCCSRYKDDTHACVDALLPPPYQGIESKIFTQIVKKGFDNLDRYSSWLKRASDEDLLKEFKQLEANDLRHLSYSINTCPLKSSQSRMEFLKDFTNRLPLKGIDLQGSWFRLERYKERLEKSNIWFNADKHAENFDVKGFRLMPHHHARLIDSVVKREFEYAQNEQGSNPLSKMNQAERIFAADLCLRQTPKFLAKHIESFKIKSEEQRAKYAIDLCQRGAASEVSTKLHEFKIKNPKLIADIIFTLINNGNFSPLYNISRYRVAKKFIPEVIKIGLEKAPSSLLIGINDLGLNSADQYKLTLECTTKGGCLDKIINKIRYPRKNKWTSQQQKELILSCAENISDYDSSVIYQVSDTKGINTETARKFYLKALEKKPDLMIEHINSYVNFSEEDRIQAASLFSQSSKGAIRVLSKLNLPKEVTREIFIDGIPKDPITALRTVKELGLDESQIIKEIFLNLSKESLDDIFNDWSDNVRQIFNHAKELTVKDREEIAASYIERSEEPIIQTIHGIVLNFTAIPDDAEYLITDCISKNPNQIREVRSLTFAYPITKDKILLNSLNKSPALINTLNRTNDDDLWQEAARLWPNHTIEKLLNTESHELSFKWKDLVRIAAQSWLDGKEDSDFVTFCTNVAKLRMEHIVPILIKRKQPTTEEIGDIVIGYFEDNEHEPLFELDTLPLDHETRIRVLNSVAGKTIHAPLHWATSDDEKMAAYDSMLKFSTDKHLGNEKVLKLLEKLEFDNIDNYTTLIVKYPKQWRMFINALHTHKDSGLFSPSELAQLCKLCIEQYNNQLAYTNQYTVQLYDTLSQTPKERVEIIAQLITKNINELDSFLESFHFDSAITSEDAIDILFKICPTSNPYTTLQNFVSNSYEKLDKNRKREKTDKKIEETDLPKLEQLYLAYAKHDDSVLKIKLDLGLQKETVHDLFFRIALHHPVQCALNSQFWDIPPDKAKELAESAAYSIYPIEKNHINPISPTRFKNLLDTAIEKLSYKYTGNIKPVSSQNLISTIEEWSDDPIERHYALETMLCLLGRKEGLFFDIPTEDIQKFGEAGALHSYAKYAPKEVAENFKTEFLGQEEDRASLAIALVSDRFSTVKIFSKFDQLALTDKDLIGSVFLTAAKKQPIDTLNAIFFNPQFIVKHTNPELIRNIMIEISQGEYFQTWVSTNITYTQKADFNLSTIDGSDYPIPGWTDDQGFRDIIFKQFYEQNKKSAITTANFFRPTPNLAGQKLLDYEATDKNYYLSELNYYEIDEDSKVEFLLQAFSRRPLQTVQEVSNTPNLREAMSKVLNNDDLLGKAIAVLLQNKQDLRSLLEQVIAFTGDEPTFEGMQQAWKRYWPHTRQAMAQDQCPTNTLIFLDFVVEKGTIPSPSILKFVETFGEEHLKLAQFIVSQCGDSFANEVCETLHSYITLNAADITLYEPMIRRFLHSGYRGFSKNIFVQYCKAYDRSPSEADKLIEELKTMSATLLTGKEIPEELRQHTLYPETIYDAYKPVNISLEEIRNLLYNNLNLQFHLENYRTRPEGYPIAPQAKGSLATQAQALINLDGITTTSKLFSEPSSKEEEKNAESEFKKELTTILLAGAPKNKAKFIRLLAYLSKDGRFDSLVDEINALNMNELSLEKIAVVIPRLQEGLNVILKDMTSEVLKEHALDLTKEPSDTDPNAERKRIAVSARVKKIRSFLHKKEEETLTEEETINALYEKTILSFKKERELLARESKKIRASGAGPAKSMIGFISKADHAYFGRAGAGLCTSQENWSWNNPDFTQMIIVDPEINRIEGNIQLHFFKGPNDEDAVLARINPTSRILETIDGKSLAKEMIDAVKAFAGDNNLQIYIPHQTGWHELTNRNEFAPHLMAYSGESYDYPVQITAGHSCLRIHKLKEA